MRALVNEHELSYNNKKKSFKYEIQLDQEKQYLDYLDNEDQTDLSGIGRLVDEPIMETSPNKGGWLNSESYYKKNSKHQKSGEKYEFDLKNYT